MKLANKLKSLNEKFRTDIYKFRNLIFNIKPSTIRPIKSGAYSKNLKALEIKSIYDLKEITYLGFTKVISNNIALSLGMVGALSIVRFRNPVKNSLELVIYFALIAIGIASGVNSFYAILLGILISFLIILCGLETNKS